MTTVLDKVRKTIEGHHLLAPGETVVVGVSGGPDSLCLLHVLCRLRSEYDLTLHVAHLHHGLRGAEAEADAGFVRDLAADWNLPCTLEQADVAALARKHRMAVEEAARHARYAFLSQVAASSGARTIAVGHNADDQTETVLMHYVRGSGLAGMRGMQARTRLTVHNAQCRMHNAQSPIPIPTTGRASKPSISNPTTRGASKPPTSEIHLIRPLLEVTRAEIESYCEYYGLEPRFDRSNLDTTYFRNWLRHTVLPLLAQHNPNVREVIRRSARVIADDYALLRSLLADTWPQVVLTEDPVGSLESVRSGEPTRSVERIVFDLAAWRALPTALQRSTLREAIHRLRRSLRDISFLHVENALQVARDGTTGHQATLPGGLMLTLGYERFALAGADTGAEPFPDWPLLPLEAAPLPVVVPGDTPLPGSDRVLRAQVLDGADLPQAGLRTAGLPAGWEANADPWRAFLDARAAGQDLWLRGRRPGDRFQPLGMGGHTVKLADFYTNQKAPRAVRDRLPLLVSQGQIVWVCGWRVDERVRVGEGTGKVLLLRFVRP